MSAEANRAAPGGSRRPGWRAGGLWRWVLPPRAWRVPVILTLGVLGGAGAVVVHISRATSYLYDDPGACINCHIMYPQYATWERGSHARVANCNDCHVPHDNVIKKYAFKANDGLRHATMFTLRMEPQVIQVHAAGIRVIQDNCVRCHENQVEMAANLAVSAGEVEHGKGKLCWECHRETPHGRVNSLSSVPHARVPGLEKVTPEWLESFLQNQPAQPRATDTRP